jgi:dGTPase
MRVSLKLPDAEHLARLSERVPAKPISGDGSIAVGLTSSGDDVRGRYRNEAQRDRDRILYSSAFQRLGGVTQVSESEPGYTFHTRLTHSLKVAQIARRCVERLQREVDQGHITGAAATLVHDTLDPDAAEASALGHDLGHPPFGHVAEDALKQCSAASFEGNAQSFRIVTRLAIRETVPGLSLTRQTLNGILKYPWLKDDMTAFRSKKWGVYESDEAAFKWVRRDNDAQERSLTAHVMDWADDLTYAVHDLDDFYRAGLVPLDRLATGSKERDRFREGLEASGLREPGAMVETLEDVLQYYTIDEPYQGRVDQRAALRTSASTLITAYLDAFSLQDCLRQGCAQIVIDESARRQVKVLKALTWVYVVMRPSLAVLQAGRRRIIEDLYERYFAATGHDGDRRLLPPAYASRLEPGATAIARSRLATDLVSSLTERAALELYRRMSGVDPGTLLDAAARLM